MKHPRLLIALAVTLPLIAAVAFAGSAKAARPTPFGKAPAFVHSLSSAAARSTPAIAASTYTVIASALHAPRGLTFGPGDRLYVAEAGLGGTPSNGAVPIIGHESEWATGLWPINGCACGPDGSLYVSELITAQDFSGGDVVKIPFNNPANHISLTNQTLPFAAGIAVARDGTVYAVGLTVTPMASLPDWPGAKS
jgi:hypothetical protein